MRKLNLIYLVFELDMRWIIKKYPRVLICFLIQYSKCSIFMIISHTTQQRKVDNNPFLNCFKFQVLLGEFFYLFIFIYFFIFSIMHIGNNGMKFRLCCFIFCGLCWLKICKSLLCLELDGGRTWAAREKKSHSKRVILCVVEKMNYKNQGFFSFFLVWEAKKMNEKLKLNN